LFPGAIRNNIHACMYVVKKRLSTVLAVTSGANDANHDL
jgi:hypothetical protein